MIEHWKEYQIVNKELYNLIEQEQTLPKIKKALKYVIKAGGKRTRPVIVLLCGKLCGGNYKKIMNMALAVELIHTASLVHDDLIDKGVKRRNIETIHVKYDVSLAILLGDWLISKSVELISIYKNEIIEDFAKVGMRMVEGETLDTYSKMMNFDESVYFKCISSKTASLFASSAKNACKIVCDDYEAANHLFRYGKNLGIAYQLVDDLIEFLDVLDDKKSEVGSITIPTIYEEKFGTEEAIYRTLEMIMRYVEKSKSELKYFEECESKEKLLKIVDYMTVKMLSKRKPEILEFL
ncbi:polyprenyl synthetase family protein [Candidatus Bathyarchaeota archaeon]|nr:MAG: polyprenyl synthetase family protein [Candidatus Bathyarchaeota archaeon]